MKKWVLNFICLVILAFALRYAALLFLLGMLPSFAAGYIDKSRDRNVLKTVTACNLAGVMPFIMELWRNGITSSSVHGAMMDSYIWLVMYGASGFGWLLVWFFPQAAYFILEVMQSSAIASLNRQQQQIVDEWGTQVQTSSSRIARGSLTDTVSSNKKKVH